MLWRAQVDELSRLVRAHHLALTPSASIAIASNKWSDIFAIECGAIALPAQWTERILWNQGKKKEKKRKRRKKIVMAIFMFLCFHFLHFFSLIAWPYHTRHMKSNKAAHHFIKMARRKKPPKLITPSKLILFSVYLFKIIISTTLKTYRQKPCAKRCCVLNRQIIASPKHQATANTKN